MVPDTWLPLYELPATPLSGFPLPFLHVMELDPPFDIQPMLNFILSPHIALDGWFSQFNYISTVTKLTLNI